MIEWIFLEGREKIMKKNERIIARKLIELKTELAIYPIDKSLCAYDRGKIYDAVGYIEKAILSLKQSSIFSEEFDMTKIKRCDCKSVYQDKKYGKGKRVFNSTTQLPEGDIWRCTVCGKEGR